MPPFSADEASLRGDQPGLLPTDAARDSQTTELPGIRAGIFLCSLNSGGLALAQGVIAGIWGWGLVYCLFNVRNVDPFWLMRCNDRSPCWDARMMWTLKMMLLIRWNKNKTYWWPLWLLACLFKVPTCVPLVWNVAPFSKGILRKCPSKPRKSVNDPWLVSKWGSQGKKASLCWGRGEDKPQVFLCESGK